MLHVYGTCPPRFPLFDVMVAVNTRLVEAPQAILEMLLGLTPITTPVRCSGGRVAGGVGESAGEDDGVGDMIVVKVWAARLFEFEPPHATTPKTISQVKLIIIVIRLNIPTLLTRDDYSHIPQKIGKPTHSRSILP